MWTCPQVPCLSPQLRWRRLHFNRVLLLFAASLLAGRYRAEVTQRQILRMQTRCWDLVAVEAKSSTVILLSTIL